MSNLSKRRLSSIPINLIMGFLGVGKTTAILDLLERKNNEEKWAVLVNEFGSVGIDGAIYSDRGAVVKEIPGGCMCCAAGLPLQVAVNRLLREAKPDRLLIEPTGLGHPRRVMETLDGEFFKDVLNPLASICLVDPRKLSDPRYINHENFVDQIVLSDVLVANKMDLVEPAETHRFTQWASDSDIPKLAVAQTVNGRLNADWLDLPRNPLRKAKFPHAHDRKKIESNIQGSEKVEGPTWQRRENFGDGYRSRGWVFPKGALFDYGRLTNWFSEMAPERAKGILVTNKGWFLFNCSDGLMTITKTNPALDSRMEIVRPRAAWTCLEKSLAACIRT